MEILAALLCIALAVQSLIKDAPCVQEKPNHETLSYQQPELPEIRETD